MQFSILFFASAVLAAPLALSTAPTFNYHDNVDNLATSKTYVDAEGKFLSLSYPYPLRFMCNGRWSMLSRREY